MLRYCHEMLLLKMMAITHIFIGFQTVVRFIVCRNMTLYCDCNPVPSHTFKLSAMPFTGTIILCIQSTDFNYSSCMILENVIADKIKCLQRNNCCEEGFIWVSSFGCRSPT